VSSILSHLYFHFILPLSHERNIHHVCCRYRNERNKSLKQRWRPLLEQVHMS